MKETQEYKGYKIEIRQDMDAENPFEAWDCEPPLIAFYGGRRSSASSYQGAPEDWYDILRLMPDAVWKRGQRVAFLKRFFDSTLREFAEEKRRVGDVEALAEMLGDQYGRKPEGWRSAIEWFEMAEALLTWGGISALSTQSTGYCQGDVTLLLVVASPDWLDKTGVQPEHVQSQLEGAAELYGHWAWGDVYGVSSIEGPDGEEIEDASCWGFYGRDHEKSGLLEHAQSAIDYHIEQQRLSALNEPACLI